MPAQRPRILIDTGEPVGFRRTQEGAYVTHVYTDSAAAAKCRAAQWGVNASGGNIFKTAKGSTFGGWPPAALPRCRHLRSHRRHCRHHHRLTGIPDMTITASTSSGMLAPQIASLTFYYNRTAAAAPAASAAATAPTASATSATAVTGACVSDYYVGNCTIPLHHLCARERALYSFESNATGLVQPSLSRMSAGRAAGSWKALDLTSDVIPATRSSRVLARRGCRSVAVTPPRLPLSFTCCSLFVHSTLPRIQWLHQHHVLLLLLATVPLHAGCC